MTSSTSWTRRPSIATVTALRQLSLLGAVEQTAGTSRLTRLGEKMAGFPLDTEVYRLSAERERLGCTEDVNCGSFHIGKYSRCPGPERSGRRRSRFHKKLHPRGDLLSTLLNVWRTYRNGPGTPAWCRSQYLVPALELRPRGQETVDQHRHNAGVSIQLSRDLETLRKAIACRVVHERGAAQRGGHTWPWTAASTFITLAVFYSGVNLSW